MDVELLMVVWLIGIVVWAMGWLAYFSFRDNFDWCECVVFMSVIWPLSILAVVMVLWYRLWRYIGRRARGEVDGNE